MLFIIFFVLGVGELIKEIYDRMAKYISVPIQPSEKPEFPMPPISPIQ